MYYRVHFLQFRVFFLDNFGGLLSFRFIKARARCFFNHRQYLKQRHYKQCCHIFWSKISYLHWFHVQHFCNTALHNQEIRIVDVHLNRTEKIRYFFIQNNFAINPVLVFAANHHLPRHGDLFAFLIAHRAIVFIGVVENNCDRCFGYTGLAIFIHQFLERGGANLKNNVTYI